MDSVICIFITSNLISYQLDHVSQCSIIIYKLINIPTSRAKFGQTHYKRVNFACDIHQSIAVIILYCCNIDYYRMLSWMNCIAKLPSVISKDTSVQLYTNGQVKVRNSRNAVVEFINIPLSSMLIASRYSINCTQ